MSIQKNLNSKDLIAHSNLYELNIFFAVFHNRLKKRHVQKRESLKCTLKKWCGKTVLHSAVVTKDQLNWSAEAHSQ